MVNLIIIFIVGNIFRIRMLGLFMTIKYYTMGHSLNHTTSSIMLGGREVSALGVRSRKLSTGLNGQS
jgi:hypothetical protein